MFHHSIFVINVLVFNIFFSFEKNLELFDTIMPVISNMWPTGLCHRQIISV